MNTHIFKTCKVTNAFDLHYDRAKKTERKQTGYESKVKRSGTEFRENSPEAN